MRSCGCLLALLGAAAILGSALAILLPSFPSIALRVAGFQPVSRGGATAAGADIPNILNPRQSGAVTLYLDGNRAIDFPPGVFPAVQMGFDETGADIARMSLSSQDILALCRLYTNYCGENGSAIRHGSIKAFEGELLLEGEAYIDVLNRWQAIQLQVRFAAEATVQFDSVALEGRRYSIPQNELGRVLREFQARVNRGARALSARSGEAIYSLASIGVVADELVLIFRAG